MLDGDHDGDQTRFGIACPAAPDVGPIVVARVRGLFPLREGGREDRDDVLVRGEEDGLERGVGTGELVDQGPVDDGPIEVFMATQVWRQLTR